jgi:transcriptional regulator with XRE-family HTH domain
VGEPHPLVAELRMRRLLRGLTLEQVALTAGIPVSTLNGWEMGRYDPPLHRLGVYAGALGMELRLMHEEENDGSERSGSREEDRQLRLLWEDG